MTIREMLGQRLAFGFQGTQLSQDFIAFMKEYKIGNVILFQRNLESEEQTRQLCAQIQQLVLENTGYPAFIIIDQEGGMVSRIPEETVNVPCAMALAAGGGPENAEKASRITIRQLRGLGVNFNLAPVLDVNNNPRNPVIGIRSFGDCPEAVAEYGAASVRPYASSGVLCCGKHFPGHGDTAVDSHLGLPRVDKTLEQLEQTELIPFRRCIREGIPAIMISHVLFPALEPDGLPSTMSRRVVTGLLKEKLGFQGLIITDCMEMGAIRDTYGTPEGTLAALRAGVDLAEISNTLELQKEAARLVNQAAEQGMLDLEEVRASAEKILAYKRTLFSAPEPALCGREEDRAAVLDMAKGAITCVAGKAPLADENTFFCGCADYRVSGAGNEKGNNAAFPQYMARAFGATGVITSKDPGEEEIWMVVKQAENFPSIVLSTCNGHLFRGQLALARALIQTGKLVTVVALRNPYDLADLPACACKIAAYDYTLTSLQALEEALRGGEMTGKCPVKL